MKVESIRIENFKRFKELEISFKNDILDEVSDRYLILGDNGSGKTTLLQAIALPLALATGRIRDISDFNWIGFLPGRYWKWGSPRIEMEVLFEQEEVDATRQIAEKWYEAQTPYFKQRREFVEPGDSRRVTLILSGDFWQAGNTPAEEAQFKGRYYAEWLIARGALSSRDCFAKLPGIFWFDQFRNLGINSQQDSSPDGRKERSSETSFDLGVARLRQYLVQWYRQQKSAVDYESNGHLLHLQKLYQKIFPERSFFGLEQGRSMESPIEEEVYFLLDDGFRTYEIEEMSSGEQSVLSILYQIVKQPIAYSVVLIDEIDLNLHPPAAQHFIGQLMKMELTCQFIVTTHSESVNNVVGESQTYRIPGGSLCM